MDAHKWKKPTAPTFEWHYLPELTDGIQDGDKYSSKTDRKLKENMQNFQHSLSELSD